MIPYRKIPLETYPRRAHFAHFSAMANPYAGVTVPVDITGFLAACRREETPFFLSFLYCASRAANRVPQLRQRILEGEIVEYAWCPTSHTVALEDGTYCYCTLESDMSFRDYLPRAQEAQELARQQRSLTDGEDGDSLLFISSIPRISYTALVQPTPFPADSNPRITWGKYFAQGDRYLLPLSVLCHHALVDGLHISRFYDTLDMVLSSLFS